MALLHPVIKTGGTASAYYETGIALTYENFSSTEENCMVHIIPCLRRIQSKVFRKQHWWTVHFYVDGQWVGQKNYQGLYGNQSYLPNDTAQAGVVAAGGLNMNVNEWYQWGDSFAYPIKNNGESHTFGIYMTCDTSPSYCPAKDTALHTALITFPKYSVSAPEPDNVRHIYDKDTRTLEYLWDDAACAYVKVYRYLRTSAGEVIRGYLTISDSSGSRDKLYNDDVHNHWVKETIPNNVVSIRYFIYNYSATDDVCGSPPFDLIFDSDNKVWVNADGVWKKAIPWVNVNGVWKKVIKTYVNKNGTWNRTVV